MSRGMWSLWALTGMPVTNVNIPASDSDATSAPRKLSEMNASRGCSALRFRQTRHVRMPRPDMVPFDFSAGQTRARGRSRKNAKLFGKIPNDLRQVLTVG
uniref:(northern house mosquito) hypothetical protein n=1 Tax=Culex pipiens TaxID=7175 RepID=A0A8D8J7N7_CULPI